MSKSIPAKLKGFTPCMDNLVKEYGIITSFVYGRVWRYCQGEDNICNASIEKISTELNLSYKTVIRHIKLLVVNGYLIDHTPKLRNHPHRYSCTNKSNIGVTVETIDEKWYDLNTEQNINQDSTRSESPSHSDFKSEPTRSESPMKKEEKESKKEDKTVEEKSEFNIFTFYENEIGTVTKVIADELVLYENEMGAKTVCDAIAEAALHNARNWKYAKAILDNWKNKGTRYFKAKNDSESKPKNIIIDSDGGMYL